MIIGWAVAGQSDDDVLDFYCERAKAVADSRDPLEHGLSFAIKARSYYKRIGGEGQVTGMDSSMVELFYSFGQLDSMKLDSTYSDREIELDLELPKPFARDYNYSFYPNDTGGADLAIGFDRDTGQSEEPVGLAIIDRTQYYYKWLYLHYPKKENYRRYSRSYRFILQDGYIFPDSIWVVATRRRLLSSESFRIETGLSDVRIIK
ncbi:MAG: hypothetical protein P1R58_04075 [bacterium]|nr:hypothetical protein [bacterium]